MKTTDRVMGKIDVRTGQMGIGLIAVLALWPLFSLDLSASGAADRFVALDLRLPRYLLALLAGAALGLSGVLLQNSLRNPLAEPGLLGVSTGASLAVAVAVVFGLPPSGAGLAGYALFGGFAAGAVILFVSRLTRDPVKMVLVGAALTALFGAGVTLVTVIGSAADVRSIYFYLTGSLTGRGWEDVHGVWPWLVVFMPAALLLAKPLNLLQLGEGVAEGLGLKVFRMRVLVFVVAISLVAPVVAHCGPIGFIALIAPHMARAMLKTSASGPVMALSMMIGATLLSSADLMAREIMRPAELPVGVIVTALGAPVALVILKRRLDARPA